MNNDVIFGTGFGQDPGPTVSEWCSECYDHDRIGGDEDIPVCRWCLDHRKGTAAE